MTTTKEKIIAEYAGGVQDSFDPELLRSFDVADQEIDEKLRKPEAVKLNPHKIRLSGDGVFYTLQGEGKTIGLPVVFARTHICNLRCIWCFPKGNKILTIDGEKDISEIKEGDLIYSYRNKNITISRVNKILERKINNLIQIITEDKRKIICTEDHEFYVNKRKSNSGKYWKLPAYKLKNKYVKSFNGFFKKQILNNKNKLGYLKGAYLGDGYCNGKDRFQLSSIDYEFIEIIQKLVNELGANCSILKEKRLTTAKNQVYRISTSKKEVIKTILNPIEGLEEMKGFIAGFFDAEGHLGRNYLNISQKDKKLLERIKFNLELYFNITCSEVKESTRCFYIQINGKRNIQKFYENFPIQISRKIYSDERRILDDILVTDIEDYNKSEIVYNLETTLGNYFVNNLLVGNCDSWYSWNPQTPEFWTESFELSVLELANKMELMWPSNSLAKKRAVITGGEPLLQKDQLDKLIEYMTTWDFEIETNGTIMPTKLQLKKCQFNCSPKLENSKNSRQARINPKVLKALNADNVDTQFKFVVMTPEEIDEVEKDFILPLGLNPNKIIFMPQGVSSKEVWANAQKIVETIKQRGYRLIGRLHVDIWGARRKV